MIPACKTLIWGSLSSVSPAFRTSKNGNYQQGLGFSRHFHNDKLCIISLRWAGKNPPMEKHIHRKSAKTILRPHLLYWGQKLIRFGSENSFWEHIKFILRAHKTAPAPDNGSWMSLQVSRAPNTIDLLRESLTDPNRPKLPRECKNTCRFFLKWSQLTHKSSQTLCLIIQFELQLGPQVPSLPGATETSGVLYPTGNALFKLEKIYFLLFYSPETLLSFTPLSK